MRVDDTRIGDLGDVGDVEGTGVAGGCVVEAEVVIGCWDEDTDFGGNEDV